MQKFTIEGRLISLNDYTDSNRANKYKGDKEKKVCEKLIRALIRKAKLKPVTEYPVVITIAWYEIDNRRDVDNVTFAKKFILDALVDLKILPKDSRKYVKNVVDVCVEKDKNNPRIEVMICPQPRKTQCILCGHDSRIWQD